MSIGKFITIEGVEGSGKSTQLPLLCNCLLDAGFDLLQTREPGGTKMGENVRSLLLGMGQEAIEPVCELFLFLSCRAQLVEKVILPAVNAGRVVVCDRYSDATVAYQGFGRGLSRKLIEQANKLATGGLKPDLTILLDIPVDDGLKRVSARVEKNRIDFEAVSFHNRVREGYLQLAKEEDKRIIIVDAGQPIEQLNLEICKIVLSFLKA